ncbi:hypothetical protein QBC40DRAFT_269849 [Triangularia verruculosa]|uniref:Uncharacterized protein n=1 Tax=Triangularia verruculosa TaxID=2587418 RepID=A0AAN7APW1_9PEZI|nr:hypothetical protein QBC40DRAFT_269849 [Triangularia verruculosa]
MAVPDYSQQWYNDLLLDDSNSSHTELEVLQRYYRRTIHFSNVGCKYHHYHIVNTSATATQPVSELENPTNETSTSNGLSTPSLVGVIIGSVVGAILLLGSTAFLVRRHRKKAEKHRPENGNNDNDESWGKAQLHGDSLPVKPKAPPQELPNSWLRELPDSGLRELPLGSDSTELPNSPNSKELQGSHGLPRYELDAEVYREQKERDGRDNMF